MKTPDRQPATGGLVPPSWHETLANSARYWEPRRLIYNAILAAVTIFWFALSWRHFLPALTPGNLLRLLGLALIANVCYCAAYLVDIPLLLSDFSALWSRRRWGLWLMGTAFAMILASYWINDEIYPFVH